MKLLQVCAQSLRVDQLEKESLNCSTQYIEVADAVTYRNSWICDTPVGVVLRGRVHILTCRDKVPRTGSIPVKILTDKAYKRCVFVSHRHWHSGNQYLRGYEA